MLDVERLDCVRGERTLFRDLSFSLEPAQLLHVAGANGTGKTSLLRILCGLLSPSRGEVRWRGRSIVAMREDYTAHLLHVGHANAVKDELSALENLEIGATLAGRRCTREAALAALESFGVGRFAHFPARTLSQGQRRRVSLARLALGAGAHDSARLWILDEPFAALDAGAVAHLERLIAAHVAGGGMVVLTTHQPLTLVAALRIDLEFERDAA